MWEVSLWALLAFVITLFVVCSIFALSSIRHRRADDAGTGTEWPRNWGEL
jgi:hypothetical protein